MSKANLITPYGGKLVNLMVEDDEREELITRAGKLPRSEERRVGKECRL